MRPALALAALIAGAAANASAGPAEDLAKLSWMAGAWGLEDGGRVVREVWLPPLGGAMAGAAQTNAPGRRPSIEHAKITVEPGGITYTAIVPGQPPTPFVLKPSAGGEAVFENLAHDFPQRVIYRRCGEDLCAAIEGTVDGAPLRETWRYRRLP